MKNNQEKIIEMLGEVLGIDDVQENITLESQLIDDLGAESIDFIDICFEIEKIFKVGKINATDLFPDELKNNQEFDEEKLNEVVNEYPYLKGEILEIMKNEKNYSSLLSVRAICKFVEWKLLNAN